MTGSTVLVVSWVDHHARSEGLARELGAPTLFMPWARPGQALRRAAMGWLRSARRTVREVNGLPPGSTVVVTAPPVFAPLCVLLRRRRRRLKVAIDLHSGALNDDRWRWSFPLMRRLLHRADLVIVTNDEIVRGVGIDEGRLAIVHDLLVFDEPPASADRLGEEPPLVLFPASGARDEPMDVVVEAAQLLRGTARIVVTGRQRGSLGDVEQVGFLPVDEYRSLLRTAAVVLTLTTREATMQQAAYEALHAGVPVVCTDTAVLRTSLEGAAIAVRHTGASIAEGVREALRRRPELIAAGARVEARLRAESDKGLTALRALARGAATPAP